MKTSMTLTLLATFALAVPASAEKPRGEERAQKSQTRADVAAKIKTRFAMLDANKDGAVLRSEVDGLREKHVAEARDRHFKAMDSNQDGAISRAEFDAGHAAGPGHARQGAEKGKHEGHKRHHLAAVANGPIGGRMFDRADANKDGKVTEAEMLAGALARFDATDANKDGVITPDERRAARQAMRAKWRDRAGERQPG